VDYNSVVDNTGLSSFV